MLDTPTGSHIGHVDNATAILNPVDVKGLNTVVLNATTASTDYFSFSNEVEGQLIWVLNASSTDGALVEDVGSVAALGMEAMRYISIDGTLTWYMTGQ